MWVLIYLICSSSCQFTTAEFSKREHCEFAMTQMNWMREKTKDIAIYGATCVPK